MTELEKIIVRSICNYQNFNSLTEVKEVIEAVTTTPEADDFSIECNGVEIRCIANDVIWQIYEDTIREIVEDCYLGGNDIPTFLEIDWKATAENCLVDGYGHTFSGYDGSEYEDNDYYYFRNN